MGRGISQTQQLRSRPFFLIDHNLSHKLAQAFTDVGFDAMSVRGAFPDRSTVPDKEIIEWLSSSGQHNSIWVTADDDAQKAHAKLIMASNISVLWVNRPRRGLSVLEELQLLSFVIQPMSQL
ncbi:MAG: DUF5615 family PIN-like protein, partial [Chloroflexi bacterium]|nr:DUF5615 family PIN-like protein [Chloroflexota bacterium]